MSRTSAEISNEIADKEREQKQMNEAHRVVQQEKMDIERQIIELELKKKNLSMSLAQSAHSLKQNRIEIKLLTNEFWSAKDAGL